LYGEAQSGLKGDRMLTCIAYIGLNETIAKEFMYLMTAIIIIIIIIHFISGSMAHKNTASEKTETN